MRLRGLLIVCLFQISLLGHAKINLPDSLLSVNKAYTFFFVSPDTARAILWIIVRSIG